MSTKRITLKKQHTHAGRKYPAGAVLELAANKAEWLIAVGTAEATASEIKSKAKE